MAFVLAGIFWGAVSLITPCVFPMIPITVSYFLKQSEKEHHRPLVMAAVYSLTIVVVLTIAASRTNLKMSRARSKAFAPWANRFTSQAPNNASMVLPRAMPRSVAGFPGVARFTRSAPRKIPGHSR